MTWKLKRLKIHRSRSAKRQACMTTVECSVEIIVAVIGITVVVSLRQHPSLLGEDDQKAIIIQ